MAINSRKSRAGVAKSSQAPVVAKIAGPSGMPASPPCPFWYLRPFSTDPTRVFTCSSSESIAAFMARNGSSGCGDITSSMRS